MPDAVAAATAAGMSVDSASELELSDFAELAQLPGMVPGAKMRMVLAPYTVRTARRQVRRLREVLERPDVRNAARKQRLTQNPPNPLSTSLDPLNQNRS